MNKYSPLTDLELMALLSEGDETAFQEIYLRYNSLLLVYAFRKLQDKEEAKDVIQEVFTNLWTSRSRLILNTAVSAYLYKSVLNKVLNIFRHKGFCDRYVADIQKLIDNDQSAADYLIREKDISTLIDKEIAAFPPRMREVFELRRKEYLTNKDIAERLSISEHTVATQIKKALRILRLKFGILPLLLYLITRN